MVLAITSCSTIDCPLNNTVTTSYKLKGDVAKLQDTLTITTPRTTSGDTVLLKIEQTGAACHTGDRTCFDADRLA